MQPVNVIIINCKIYVKLKLKMWFFILIGEAVLNFIYLFYKLIPTQNRITIISKQEDEPSEDIVMLAEELGKHTTARVDVMCKTIGTGKIRKLEYLAYMMTKQLPALASSKAVVLDGYCVSVSILKHKKSLMVFQMWHATGAIKKFGYYVVDKKEGYSKQTVKNMKMHKNYNVIFVGSEACKELMAPAFGYSTDVACVSPLPRIDKIVNKKLREAGINAVLGKYPGLKEKKVIFYAPTFREQIDMKPFIEKLIKAVDYERYNLVIKLHPHTTCGFSPGRSILVDDFSSTDLLNVCDCFVTDYSSVAFEAALAGKPIFRYVPDYDEYARERGLFDTDKELPAYCSGDADEIMKAISENKYDMALLQAFAKKYIDARENNSAYMSNQIVELSGLKKQAS